jgi:hypothetical protein
MNIFAAKIKEILFTVLPVAVVVLILNFTLVPLETNLFIRFFIGTALVILGLTLFLTGVDLGIMPFGNLTGKTLAKKNKLWLIIIGGIVLGFFISVAEPGLLVLALRTDEVTGGQIPSITLLLVVSAGLAVLMTMGFLRIIFNISFKLMLFVFYLIVLVLAIFASQDFTALAFDASGATTGILAVPFLLALAAGISSLKKDSLSSEESSFGLVSFASVGAIMGVLLLNVISPSTITPSQPEPVGVSQGIIGPFIDILPSTLSDGLLAMSPIIVIFLLMQFVFFKLDKKHFFRIFKGFIYSLLGLILFLLGVNAGFMEVGAKIGEVLASDGNKAYIIITGFALGFLTIMAEPAVYVLTHQIEDITSGYIKRRAVLFSLAAGAGLALLLSVVRILFPAVQLWHILLVGYVIAFGLSLFAPRLFVGIAFDAGGVATGPITATFILAFIQGAAYSFEGSNVIAGGFGMIALVALFPIITLQILGIIYKVMTKRRNVK